MALEHPSGGERFSLPGGQILSGSGKGRRFSPFLSLFIVFSVLLALLASTGEALPAVTSAAEAQGVPVALGVPAAPSDTPVQVVNETFSNWTLNSGLLYWAEGCPGGEISFDGYIRRLPVNGGKQITLGTVTPTTCVTYINLVADGEGVYYFDSSIGPRIESRLVGSPTTANTVFNLVPALVPVGDRLAVFGSYVYWLTANSLQRVGKDGSGFATVATGLSGTSDLIAEGNLIFWLDSGGLWVTDVTSCSNLPCAKQNLSAVTGSHLMYYYRSFPIFQAGSHLIYASGSSFHQVICSWIRPCTASTLYSVPVDGNPWELGTPATDGTNLYWEEAYFGASASTGRLRRMPLNGGTAVDIATNLYFSPSPVYIDTNNVYFASVDNYTNDILKLPLNASALVRDLSADAFEITQGIQNLANDVPLTAGKATYVRAYATENSGPPAMAVDAYLYGTINNLPLPGSPLHSLNGRQAIATGAGYARANPNAGWLFQLPDSWISAGTISLRLGVDPLQTYTDSNLTNNQLTKTAVFQTRKVVCPVFIPVSTDAPLPSTKIANFWQMIDYAQRLWPTTRFIPFHQDDLLEKLTVCTWHGIPYPCTRPYDLPGDTWELFTDIGIRDLFTNDPSECDAPFGTTHYVGMVDPSTSTGTTTGTGMTSLFNYSWVKFSNDLAASNDPFAPVSGETLAHELAHNLGREHVACGGADNPDPGYPYPTNQIDNVGNANHYGFDIKSLSPIAPDAAKDLMSYCTPKWISDYTWKALFNGGLNPAALAVPALPSARLASAASNILVSGAITPTTGSGELGYAWNFSTAALNPQMLNKWQQLSDQNAAALSASSPLAVIYHLRLLGSTGSVLADQIVNPVAPHIHEGPSLVQIFLATFPAPAGSVAKIQLMQGSTVLASRSPGAAVPTVSVLKPAGGETIGDTLEMSWQAQDTNQGDVLHYSVQYSPDNGKTWRSLATDLTNLPGATLTSLTLHPSGIPGSTLNGALIRVAASDGYNTGFGVSKPFTLTNRKPQVDIQTPVQGESIPAGQSAALRGQASDAEDGLIQNAGLSWTVDAQAAGSGGEVNLPGLAPGDHPVVLTARDSISQTATAQATLTILPLSIPNGTTPTLDGYCDDAGYASGSQVLLKPHGANAPASVRLLRDSSAIWICFSGLTHGGASPGSFAGVRVDANHSRDNQAQSNDYGFFAGEDGSVFSSSGNGAGGFSNPGPGGVTGRISATAGDWSTELRIDAATIGGFDHLIGLNLGQYSISAAGDDTPWPYASTFNQPKTWATTALAPLPSISSLNPASTTAGGLGLTLVISGENFLSGSQVLWNGTPFSPTLTSSSNITITLSAAQLHTAGSIPVAVRNPGGIDSGALPFTLNNPKPAISSLLPGSVRAEGPTFTLQVNGIGYVSAAKVYWNGQKLATTFTNSGHLSAQVDSGLITSGGTASITVINPGPGGGASAAASFTVLPNYTQFLPEVRK